eukprot:CAMPEP_0174884598 /NCGR_PEP_ID=MMETSP0167-20121228/5_1 /TAXON_ID=38298 /ORGANISM="Rhodella maculata, Strain CCMP736" /LENGTH=103 /DNA_ID=CAMNT_0016120001 /DNA_START=281 /DNA_END=593 /DNA_ORIENTATION=-
MQLKHRIRLSAIISSLSDHILLPLLAQTLSTSLSSLTGLEYGATPPLAFLLRLSCTPLSFSVQKQSGEQNEATSSGAGAAQTGGCCRTEAGAGMGRWHLRKGE